MTILLLAALVLIAALMAAAVGGIFALYTKE